MANIHIYSYILYNQPGVRPYIYDYTEHDLLYLKRSPPALTCSELQR